MIEETALRERQRIIADLHDGLGAVLFSLLQYLRSGQANASSIERYVHDAIRELRVAVDGLNLDALEIESVLGNLRRRLGETIHISGVELEWQVEKLPHTRCLNGSSVLSVQRIMIEAVTNALRHSGCRRISITARVLKNEDLEITIRDDGRGFDPRGAAGLGLKNMRSRADRIGAQLDIASRMNGGTTVRLTLKGGLRDNETTAPAAILGTLSLQHTVPRAQRG